MIVSGFDQVLPSSVERMSIARPPRGASTSVGMPRFLHSAKFFGSTTNGVGGEACQ
jgi:hypothetical protein